MQSTKSLLSRPWLQVQPQVREGEDGEHVALVDAGWDPAEEDDVGRKN